MPESSLRGEYMSTISYSTMQIIANKIFYANANNINKFTRIEVKDGFDVVTDVDTANEADIREILVWASKKSARPTKEIVEPISLAGIYGKENGYQKVSDDGKLYAIIDPIDGTRAFVNGIFYSAVSVALVNKDGITVAGILILINNQINNPYESEKYEVFLFDKGQVFVSKSIYPNNSSYNMDYKTFMDASSPIKLHFEKFSTSITESTLNKECISLTDVKSYEEQ